MKVLTHKKYSIIFLCNGFTIVELMVAIALGLVITAISYATFISVQRSVTSQDQISEMQSTTMISLDLLSRDIKEAGFGVPEFFRDINGQERVVEYQNNTGAFGSDKLHLIGAYRQLAELSSSTQIGDYGITVKYLDNVLSKFDLSTRKNLSIMGLQNFTISRLDNIDDEHDHLIFNGSALNKNFPQGAPVFLVENVFYTVNDQNKFIKNGCIDMPTLNYTIAENVDNMQIVGIDQNRDNKFERLRVFLLSKTEKSDLNYKNSGHDMQFNESTEEWNITGQSDSYKRRLLSLVTALRNGL
jgi:prepilin-type N-terminal cleavage/methylation domain-containing protein